MRKIVLLLTVFTAFFALAACDGEDAQYADRIEINFWHQSPVGSESYSGVRSIIRTFNDSQENYFVKGVGINFWDYWDRINVAIASDNAPDLGYHTIDNVIFRAENDALYNISDLIAEDEARDIDTLDTSIFLENQLDFSTYDGDLYALPFSATTRVLYYNLDLFEEAGLSEADVPTTWSELETVAKQLDQVDGDGDIEVLGFEPSYGESTYHQFLWQKGLDFFDEDLDPTLNTDEHLEVLQWMNDFNEDFSKSEIEAFGEANETLGLDPFSAGRVAMYVGSDGLYETLRPLEGQMDYGVAPIPIPDDDGIRVNWGSGFSIEMYKGGDEEEKQGTWEFLKYLLEHDTQLEFAEATGWLTSNIPAMEEYTEGNEILEAFMDELPYARDKVYVPYAPNWHADDWDQYYIEGVAGRMTAEEVLEAARNHYLTKQENYQE